MIVFNFLFAIIALLMAICWSLMSCTSKMGSDEVNIVAVKGEVFLSGPDERRVYFKTSENEAKQIYRILLKTTKGKELIYQGRASFVITYKDGKEDLIQVCDQEVVIFNGTYRKLPNDRLLKILEKYWNNRN